MIVRYCKKGKWLEREEMGRKNGGREREREKWVDGWRDVFYGRKEKRERGGLLSEEQ